MTSVSADNFSKVITINGTGYELLLAKIIPNAAETITESPAGEPIVSLLVTKNMMEKETLTLKRGDLKTSNGISFGFASPKPSDINISLDSGKFFVRSGLDLGEQSMMTREVTPIVKGKLVELKEMQILSFE